MNCLSNSLIIKQHDREYNSKASNVIRWELWQRVVPFAPDLPTVQVAMWNGEYQVSYSSFLIFPLPRRDLVLGSHQPGKNKGCKPPKALRNRRSWSMLAPITWALKSHNMVYINKRSKRPTNPFALQRLFLTCHKHRKSRAYIQSLLLFAVPEKTIKQVYRSISNNKDR